MKRLISIILFLNFIIFGCQVEDTKETLNKSSLNQLFVEIQDIYQENDSPLKVWGVHDRAKYSELSSNILVSEEVIVLKQEIYLPSGKTVFVESDGALFPLDPTAGAAMVILIDGVPVSNGGVIEWAGVNSEMHSYNIIGAKYLSTGIHEVSLVGIPFKKTSHGQPYRFFVNQKSNLTVMVPSAREVAVKDSFSDTWVPTDHPTWNTSWYRPSDGSSATEYFPVPHVQLPGASYSWEHTDEDVIALGSGFAKYTASRSWPWADFPAMTGNEGDALLGLYLDGANSGNDKSSWSFNDLNHGGEWVAPLYCHGFWKGSDITEGLHTLTLQAAEFPWGFDRPDNQAAHVMAGGSRLLVLRGDMKVKGGAYPTPVIWGEKLKDNTMAMAKFLKPSCNVEHPQVLNGQPEEIVGQEIIIPEDHDGVVFFAAKARLLTGKDDAGGLVSFWIEIGPAGGTSTPVGSVGLQRYHHPFCESARTVSASYLAAGENALKPGIYYVKVMAKADGCFKHVGVTADLPLIWFD